MLRKEDIRKRHILTAIPILRFRMTSLDKITVIRKDKTTEDIIVNGRFVVPGTEKLNEPLDALDCISETNRY